MRLRFPEPPRGLDGLPAADAREARVARAVMWIATAWFVLVAGWEMFGPILAGHYAAAGGMGIMADNMLRWRIAGPVWEYTRSAPGPEMYYCHHPWGTFWTTALAMKVFGRHDVVARLPAILLSAITPPMLYALGRAIWRPAAGAAAALAFVVLPITLSFAAFNALEVPVIAWSIVGLWGFVRMTQTGRRLHFAIALLGSTLALHADWPGFMLAGAMLAIGLFRGFLAPRWLGRVRHERRYAAWWIWSATLAVVTLLFYLWLFQRSNKLSDLFGSYGMRSAGNVVPLSAVLASRRYWIELSFTPIAIFLGKAMAVVSLLRLLILRREHEAIPLAVLLMATVQYVVFKQGADIHVFWPQYFGAYFALAMGALVATLAGLFEHLRPLRARAAIVALGLASLPLAAIARDGVPALVYARETGGRFNEKGLIIDSDGDKTAFLRWAEPRLPRGVPVGLHEGMRPTWAQTWALGGRVVTGGRALPSRARNSRSIYFTDTRYLLSDLQGQLARDYQVTAVGPFWMVDEANAAGPIEAFSFVEREPSWWAWYFVSGTEPSRAITPDPWLTWELRAHFGQPVDPPSGAPITLTHKRIAHNLAVDRGDTAGAAALRAEIDRALHPIGAAWSDGTRLVGSTYQRGARPLLTLFIEASGPAAADLQLSVKSKVTARARGSLTMADPTEREVGLALSIPAPRWKKGFLYEDPLPIRKRPGTEVFRASLTVRGAGAAPKRVDASGPVVVLTAR